MSSLLAEGQGIAKEQVASQIINKTLVFILSVQYTHVRIFLLMRYAIM